MSDYSEAAGHVQSLAEKFRGILDLADALKGLGSVDQAIEESKAALKQAQAAKNDALQELKKVQDAIKGVNDKQRDEKIVYDKYLVDVKEQALIEAQKIKDSAKASAESTIKAAQDEVLRIESLHKNKMDVINTELTKINSDLKNKQGLLNEAASQHDDLQQKMNNLKDQARAVAA